MNSNNSNAEQPQPGGGTSCDGVKFAPNLLAQSGFHLIVFIAVVCCLALWRICVSPASPFAYIVLPILIFNIVVLATPLKTFKIEGGQMVVKGFLGIATLRTLPLCDIERVWLDDMFFTAKMKDGTVISLKYTLSDSRKKLMRQRLEECGVASEDTTSCRM